MDMVTVHASVACSIDGYIDDSTSERLILSSHEDFTEVHKQRSECDAILVGANTIRKDNPSLLIRDSELRKARIKMGLPADLIKVTLTSSGILDPQSRFFQTGENLKIILCPESAYQRMTSIFSGIAKIISVPQQELGARRVLEELSPFGIKNLFLEGGSSVLTEFLVQGMVNTFRVAIAPFFVGDPQAPRMVHPGSFIHSSTKRMVLKKVTQLGDMAALDYQLERRP